jgi:hypothetical protein
MGQTACERTQDGDKVLVAPGLVLRQVYLRERESTRRVKHCVVTASGVTAVMNCGLGGVDGSRGGPRG